MKKLFYLPLESYVERYTYYMSCPEEWAEDWFARLKVPFFRIEGMKVGSSINVGSVLDVYSRSKYAMSQIMETIQAIEMGRITWEDTIYVEDFWHPGIEALFYIRDLTGIQFKIGTFIHAQSIDDTDFTYPMRNWMRPIEIGFSHGYDYIFTCSDILKRLAVEAGYNGDHIFKVGLPFNSVRLLKQLSQEGFVRNKSKEGFVLFSSRFDIEKNPHFFLDLVIACPDIQFKLVKPRNHLTNDLGVIKHLEQVQKDCDNLEIVDTSNKLVYYDLLDRAQVQFNCAKQDWVSWTLLEAILFGCQPLYPHHKDFPFELAGFEEDHIYENENLEDAARKLRVLMEEPFDCRLRQIVNRHDESWRRYLEVMGYV